MFHFEFQSTKRNFLSCLTDWSDNYVFVYEPQLLETIYEIQQRQVKDPSIGNFLCYGELKEKGISRNI